jgi:hypothetical protein
MFNIFLVIIAYVLICLFEVPSLIRDKYWRDLATFSVFLLSAFILSLLMAAGVKLPLIDPMLYKAFTPLFEWLGVI